MYSFPDLEPVCCFISSFNCCFLTCIQISQEAGKVLWYSHLKNFPQFVVIHTVKGFGIVNKAEVYVFLEISCFFDDPMDIGNLISGSSAISKSSLNIWKVRSIRSHHFMVNRWGNNGNSERLFSLASKPLLMVTTVMKFKDICSLEEKL